MSYDILRQEKAISVNGINKARRVWRYQRGNQNQYIEEQTAQWPNEHVQKDKQRSTKHTHKTKYRVTQNSELWDGS